MKSLHVKSYPQALSTRVQNLWDTPKTMRKLFTSLTGAVRSNRLKRAAEADSARGRIDLMGKVYALLAVLSITSISSAEATNYSVDQLKLYAHSRLLNYDQFMCFNKIITKESRWSYTARNGSHYGLGQMRSTWYRDLDPYRQIDATIRYVTKRYSTSCKAWAFHQQRNYF